MTKTSETIDSSDGQLCQQCAAAIAPEIKRLVPTAKTARAGKLLPERARETQQQILELESSLRLSEAALAQCEVTGVLRSIPPGDEWRNTRGSALAAAVSARKAKEERYTSEEEEFLYGSLYHSILNSLQAAFGDRDKTDIVGADTFNLVWWVRGRWNKYHVVDEAVRVIEATRAVIGFDSIDDDEAHTELRAHPRPQDVTAPESFAPASTVPLFAASLAHGFVSRLVPDMSSGIAHALGLRLIAGTSDEESACRGMASWFAAVLIPLLCPYCKRQLMGHMVQTGRETQATRCAAAPPSRANSLGVYAVRRLLLAKR